MERTLDQRHASCMFVQGTESPFRPACGGQAWVCALPWPSSPASLRALPSPAPAHHFGSLWQSGQEFTLPLQIMQTLSFSLEALPSLLQATAKGSLVQAQQWTFVQRHPCWGWGAEAHGYGFGSRR